MRIALALLYTAFLIGGAIASLQTGLHWDDRIEQQTFQANRRAFEGLLDGDLAAARAIHFYRDRYYGIGFHALAYPLQVALQPYVERSAGIDAESSLLLGKHAAAFVMFALSVVIFHRLLRIFVRNRFSAALFTATYAIYPYLFGHGMLSIKDIPYMSAWLLGTYLSIRLVRHQLAGKTRALHADALALLLATAFLASIRLPGLLILAQYAVTFALADRASARIAPPRREIVRLSAAFVFLAALLGLVLAAYPVLWLDHIEGLIGALRYLGRHPWNHCTLTWGECMPAQDLPATYLPGWLVVKLPLMVLAGLVLTPFAYRRIAGDPLKRVTFLALAFGASFLLVYAIAARTPLYDESRQFLFVYPALFLLACVALNEASRRWSLIAASLSLALFALDHWQLHPYQYVYFNEAARFLDLDRMFETDYFGASGRDMSRLLAANPAIVHGTECIYAAPFEHYRPFIDAGACVKDFADYNRQPPQGSYVLAAYTRSRLAVPAGCTLVAEVARTFPLSARKATMAVAYRCGPP
jgi:hypothetical protein